MSGHMLPDDSHANTNTKEVSIDEWLEEEINGGLPEYKVEQTKGLIIGDFDIVRSKIKSELTDTYKLMIPKMLTYSDEYRAEIGFRVSKYASVTKHNKYDLIPRVLTMEKVIALFQTGITLHFVNRVDNWNVYNQLRKFVDDLKEYKRISYNNGYGIKLNIPLIDEVFNLIEHLDSKYHEFFRRRYYGIGDENGNVKSTLQMKKEGNDLGARKQAIYKYGGELGLTTEDLELIDVYKRHLELPLVERYMELFHDDYIGEQNGFTF